MLRFIPTPVGNGYYWTVGNRQREVFADTIGILGSGDFSVDFLKKVVPHIFDVMVEALSTILGIPPPSVAVLSCP